jgi:nicotinate dehydrogenase subunit B
MSTIEKMTTDVFGATLTRRKFVKGTGALVVGLSVAGAATAGSTRAAAGAPNLDPTLASSWIEIHADNTITMRTGVGEMGQGSASGALAQVLAEELNVSYDQITRVVMGDTDGTPDGGISAGFLMKRPGSTNPEPFGQSMLNMQRAAAYTYQALLSLASTKLGVPVGQLSAKNGVVSGGGKTVSYGDLVAGQSASLKIPATGTQLTGVTVTGTPPLKPMSQWSVLGTSQPMKALPDIINGKAPFVADIRLPGMLHARIVRPPTVGSTLVSVGKVDKRAWPTTQVVVKGNLVGVLSPNEWEAIGAAADVSRKSKWTAWEGLPNSASLPAAMRNSDYSHVPITVGGYNPITGGNGLKGDAEGAIKGAAKTLSATYFVPYIKHGPIGPSISLADVRQDGTVHMWVHGQAMQRLRGHIADALALSPDKIYVHWTVGAGHYGRSNGGTEGGELDAVILSQAVGKPVRVTWMRPEDFQWSTQQQAMLMDIQTGLDAKGNMVAFRADYYGMGTQDDRPSGALLAGLNPGPDAPIVTGISNEWPYDVVPNVLEKGHGSDQLGQPTSPNKIGLRSHSFRTPTHRQENFAAEGMVNEAAAYAKVDPIEYRIRHTTDQRLITVLNTLKKEHGWVTRPSPSPNAKASGSGTVSGQGMIVLLRFNAVWAAAANITVNLKTGKIQVDKYTGVVEPGLAVNPRQLQRNFEGGTVMGISEALHEETTFNKGTITSVDWVTYPILRMNELPPIDNIKIIVIDRRDLNVAGMGGEAPNGLPPGAIAAAFFDATGKVVRQTPLRPGFVRNILKS